MGNYTLKNVALRYSLRTKRYGLNLSLCLYEAEYNHSESGDFYYEHRWDLEPSKETMATAEELYNLGFDKFDSATMSKPLNVQSRKEDYTFILEALKENYFDENVLKAYNLLPYELKSIFEKEVLIYGNTISEVSSGYDERSGKGLKITFCDKLHFYSTAPMIKGGLLQGVYRLNGVELGAIMGVQESPKEKYYPYVGQYLYCDYAMGVDEWMQTRKLEYMVKCEYCIDVKDVMKDVHDEPMKDTEKTNTNVEISLGEAVSIVTKNTISSVTKQDKSRVTRDLDTFTEILEDVNIIKEVPTTSELPPFDNCVAALKEDEPLDEPTFCNDEERIELSEEEAAELESAMEEMTDEIMDGFIDLFKGIAEMFGQSQKSDTDQSNMQSLDEGSVNSETKNPEENSKDDWGLDEPTICTDEELLLPEEEAK